ncbi:MAG: cell division protein ZapA [Hyphomonadaceae bacterium]|nr:cell division protein ZapA [Hyphomonadaceae bacterium]
MQANFDVLGQGYSVECADGDAKRLADLARTLELKLSGFSGDGDAMRRLVLMALSLLDEAQATGAALARARGEIERLTDMVVEAKLEAEQGAASQEPQAAGEDRGRVSALRRVAQGVA